MRSINRAALVVRLKPPFVEWASSLEDGVPEPMDPWCSVYLVEAAEAESPASIVRRNFEAIFDEQLASWHQDEDDWPARRKLSKFHQWLEVEVVEARRHLLC